MTGIMAWELLWALCLGFLLSGIVEAVVSKENVGKLLPDSSSASTIVIASALGAASSSCSYAATALARTLFRKGADFIAAIAFQFASTNLVVELSVLLAVLLGWQFMAGRVHRRTHHDRRSSSWFLRAHPPAQVALIAARAQARLERGLEAAKWKATPPWT